jgi:hypothetical protein
MIKMQQVRRPLFDLPGTVHSVCAKSSCAKFVGPPTAGGQICLFLTKTIIHFKTSGLDNLALCS